MYSRNLPIGAAYNVLRVPPDSVPRDSLARFDHRHMGPQFAVLPLGLEKLSATLSITIFVENIHATHKHKIGELERQEARYMKQSQKWGASIEGHWGGVFYIIRTYMYDERTTQINSVK